MKRDDDLLAEAMMLLREARVALRHGFGWPGYRAVERRLDAWEKRSERRRKRSQAKLRRRGKTSVF